MPVNKFDGIKSGMTFLTEKGNWGMFLGVGGSLHAYWIRDGKLDSYSQDAEFVFRGLEPAVKIFEGASRGNNPMRLLAKYLREADQGPQLWPTPQVEVTLKEVAEKMGIPVEQLRIKDE